MKEYKQIIIAYGKNFFVIDGNKPFKIKSEADKRAKVIREKNKQPVIVRKIGSLYYLYGHK